MYSLHATKKLLDRADCPTEPAVVQSTSLGNWYANALFWKPQVVILVNEKTLLPLFMPLAPARTLGQRVPGALRLLLRALGVETSFVEHECGEMAEVRFSRTASRSILGSMNDFVRQANWIQRRDDTSDLLTLARELSHTPCRVIREDAIWPDDEVRAVEARWLADQT
jgi:hypothetical protein